MNCNFRTGSLTIDELFLIIRHTQLFLGRAAGEGRKPGVFASWLYVTAWAGFDRLKQCDDGNPQPAAPLVVPTLEQDQLPEALAVVRSALVSDLILASVDVAELFRELESLLSQETQQYKHD